MLSRLADKISACATWFCCLILTTICSPATAQSTTKRLDALEQRMTAVEQRLTAVENTLQPLHIDVDCSSGQTVGAALAQAAQHPRPVTINILGQCSEAVTISRNDVTLQGGELVRPTGQPTTVLTVGVGLTGIQLSGVTLTGGGRGLRIRSGSRVGAQDLTIQGSNGHFGGGLSLEWGGYLRIFSSTIRNNAWGGIFIAGGEADIFALTIEDNGGAGLVAESGGRLLLQGNIVRRNSVGLRLTAGATAAGEENTFDDNNTSGAFLDHGSLFMALSSFSSNGADGVTAVAGSWVSLFGTTLAGNAGIGVRLRDTSVGSLAGGNQITQNGGFGVFCDPPPAVAQAVAGSVLDGSTVFLNTAGDSNCPTNP